MDITFSKELFTQAKLFVGTPMYGGSCTSNYVKGMVDLSAACTAYNLPFNLHGIEGSSIVQMGRNLCVNDFLESDYTHFLFIDADIGFSAKDALSLLSLSLLDKEKKYDIIAGPYPKKKISWKKVKSAVEKGLIKQDPNELANYIGDYTFISTPEKPFSLNTPEEILEVGTGFMLIPRRTFEKFKEVYPETIYKDKGKKKFAFFNCGIDPETNEFLAEDRLFCQKVRKMGGKVWLAPWLRLSHQGSYSFQGSLSHIAALGMSPADL